MEPYSTRRSTYILLLLFFLLSTVLFTVQLVRQRQEIRQKAAIGASLSLVSAKTSYAVGEEAQIEVNVDTATYQVAAADVTINFDPNIFSGVSFTQGAFLPMSFVSGAINNGQAHIVVAANPSEPKQGQGTIAVLKLKALSGVSSTRINFDPATQVAALGEAGNVVQTFIPLDLNVVTQVNVVPDTVLSLVPESHNVSAGEKFYLPVKINTGVNEVTGVDLAVVYDTNKLEGVSISNAGFLPNILTAGTITQGVAKIVLGSDVSSARKGEGFLAVLEFKALENGSTQVVFDNSTQVANLASSQNVIKSLGNSTINIGQITQISPSPVIGGACVSNRPLNPTNLTVEALNTHQASLSWNPQTNATHYGIVYGLKPGVYLYGAANVGNTSSYTVSGLAAGNRYYFAVFAVNDCAPSDYSNEVGIIMPSPAGTAETSSEVGSAFTPLNPNTEAIPFLMAKPRPSATPLPALNIPSDYTSPEPESAGINYPLWIAIGIFIILLTIFILFLLIKRKD